MIPPIYILKKQAKELAKREHISHLAALDRVAQTHGFKRWSLLQSTTSSKDRSSHILQQLSPGDLMLLGARPGHGKTQMGLELLAKSVRQGRRGWFFTLEYCLRDVLEQLQRVDKNPVELGERLCVDDSDDINASHIKNVLQQAPPASVIVIDYLQLLDQKRTNAPLQQQIETVKRLAKEKGLIMILISQIDRSVESSDDTIPTIKDIRLPNPLDLRLFDKTCFLTRHAMTCSTNP